jgi:hypothetical protein
VAAGALPSPAVRMLWYVAVFVIVIGLGALGTTCTGSRPRPTGETIPAPAGTTTSVAP